MPGVGNKEQTLMSYKDVWAYQQHVARAVMAMVILLLCGCEGDNAWTAAFDESYSDNVQKIVEEQVADRTSDKSALKRWQDQADDNYQSADDIKHDPIRLKIETERRQSAHKLISAGPLTITRCLVHSLAFNDEIVASRAAVKSLAGEKIIVLSRFLPHISYRLRATTLHDEIGRHLAMSVLASQSLLEFGKDNPLDVNFRQLERDFLFSHEETVANVISAVRLKFWRILLRQKQLAERLRVRDGFTERYKKMVNRREAKEVLELDVLTARLNVLDESLRINRLEKDIEREKKDLAHAMGFPVDMADFLLSGELKEFSLSVDDATVIAFNRSTRIAQSRAAVYERDRVLRQIVWEYFPHVDIVGGYRGRHVATGGSLVSNDSVYSANPFVKYHNDGFLGRPAEHGPAWLNEPTSGGFFDAVVELPILDGKERIGRFKRERGLLERDRRMLCNTIWLTNRDVRKAYETVEERVVSMKIRQERVEIAKARLSVKERFKELGEISDDELETFRREFFVSQDTYFEEQILLLTAQERLRRIMRYFEPTGGKEAK